MIQADHNQPVPYLLNCRVTICADNVTNQDGKSNVKWKSLVSQLTAVITERLNRIMHNFIFRFPVVRTYTVWYYHRLESVYFLIKHRERFPIACK